MVEREFELLKRKGGIDTDSILLDDKDSYFLFRDRRGSVRWKIFRAQFQGLLLR